MTNRHQLPDTQRITGNKLPLLLAMGALLMTSSCAMFPKSDKTQLSDDAVRQYVDEWREVKPSIERLASLEGDLSFLLAEVSKMSDITQTPGLALADHVVDPSTTGIAVPSTEPVHALAPTDGPTNLNAGSTTTAANSSTSTDATAPPAALPDHVEAVTPESSCPAQYAAKFRKSIAVSYFPRTQPATSSAGQLHQVDQHLPMLLSANLKTRHGIQVQTQLPYTFYNATHQGEHSAAGQAKTVARQHKVQFLITGAIHDMSLVSPEIAYAHDPYNRLVKGAINLFSHNGLNTQSRMFEFQLQVRSGFSGEIILDETYQTMGNWEAIRPSNIGFGTARFWQTDYGQKVQHLIAHASDKLATTLACQPFIAHADVSPSTRQVVVHGGANNGFKAGDTLAVYQIMNHPIPGEYLRYHSSMVDTDANVSLVSVYPSHSIAESNQDLSSMGSFLVMEPRTSTVPGSSTAGGSVATSYSWP